MRKEFIFVENKINVVIEIADDGDVRLLHFSLLPYVPVKECNRRAYRLVGLQVAGYDHNDHHGHKHTGTMPGECLRFKDSRDYRNDFGRKLELVMQGEGIETTTNMQFYDGVSAVRSWNIVQNIGEQDVVIEYISSFCLNGISKEGICNWDEKSLISIPHNTCFGEGQWQTYTAGQLGLSKVIDSEFNTTKKRVSISSLGTLSASEYLPMGYYENSEKGTGLMWQIENNGSWQWEISDMAGELYVQISGPTENESHWSHRLLPGESFKTVSVAVCTVVGGFEKAVQELTLYRRLIRRLNNDNKNLPVIFNDYMNCLWGNPTTAKELPLIDAAAKVGCEYYCIDCGWYSDGFWWDYVGEWIPSNIRFPRGIIEVINYIKSRGMIPGLWLEIEVMGVKCPMAHKVPDSWFFKRHGKPVIENGRYQLDFRNLEVIKHADNVIERLVREYGVGYIKMDYNIDAGPGTETDADSFGDGLLKHNRAYLEWLDRVFVRYPDLVIENCSSGGLRMDYALLSRYSILSSSDQANYKKYAKIAASVITGVTPEQSAIWSCPLLEGDREEVVFNMINAMLMRIHQSGNLAEISNDRLELVREGIECYKRIRGDIPKALPFWPLGIPDFDDEWISFGLETQEKAYLSLYRMQSSKDAFELPLPKFKGKNINIKCIYPKEENCTYNWNPTSGLLSVKFPSNYSARLFEINMR